MAIISYPTTTQPQESIDGLTFYKNGGQLAMRSRAYPLRVKSQAHIVPMNAIAVLSMLWESPLTNADRIAWGNYAFATPLEDAYGNPRYVKGYAHFMRVNRPLLQHGLPLQLAPPATTGLPTFTAATLGTVSGTNTVTVTITNSDTWANQTGAHMMLWISRQRSPRRRYPPEVYKPLGTVPGNGTTPPTNDQTFPNPWGFVKDTATQWLRGSVIDINGRLSMHTSGTNTNPKRMGTVHPPTRNPCSGVTITFRISGGPWTRATQFPFSFCIPVPTPTPATIDITGNSLSGWSRVPTPPGSTTVSLGFNCSDPPNSMRAVLTFNDFVSSQFSQYNCTHSNNGIGTYTATDACTLPTTLAVTQV